MFSDRYEEEDEDAEEGEESELRRRYGPMKPDPSVAAPKRRRGDSARDQGTQKAERPNYKLARKTS